MAFANHQTVLLKEAMEALSVIPTGIYVDGTFGRGGHSKAILKELSQQGKLFALDKDLQAVLSGKVLERDDHRFQILHDSFIGLKAWMQSLHLLEKVNGILLDLGVSSPQLDEAERGFSFMRDGPLDMRMNTETGQTAASWIATVKVSDLADVLRTYGEERYAKRIAQAIVDARNKNSITTTKQLAEIVKKANPRWEKHIHPATRSFQAIRIFINHELEELPVILENSLDILKKGGRLVVISFHSLEDRIVKRFMRKCSNKLGLPDRYLTEKQKPKLKVVGKLIRPTVEEIKENPRARSAILRVAEKI